MIKLLTVLTLLFNFGLHAQDELEPKEIQEVSALTVWLPFKVSLSGDVSFLKSQPSETFLFSPLVSIAPAYSNARYVYPTKVDSFVLSHKDASPKWLEVHRRKLQVGIGGGVGINDVMKLGLFPFKGASHKFVRTTQGEKSTKLPLSLLPSDLSDVKSWNPGDSGSFETTGGIELQASTGVGLLEFGSATFTIQNEFTIEIKKLSDKEVSLGLFEGKVHKRKITLGPIVSNLLMGKMSGKRLGAEFILNPQDASHAELYQHALAGKISELQAKLPHTKQKLSWKGSFKGSTLGVPVLAVRDVREGKVQLSSDTNKTLYFKSKKTSGFILPARNVHRMVYATDRELVLFWSSELKKASGAALNKYFIYTAHKLGLNGFEQRMQPKDKMGFALTQLGVVLTTEEIQSLRQDKMAALSNNYLERCQAFQLKCRHDQENAKILSRLNELLEAKGERRAELGKYLIKHPVLFHSLIKSMGVSKKGYFYFLSDRFKSLEGMAQVEI